MKKITLLLTLLISSIGFSQEVLQDFETSPNARDPFGGAAFSLVSDPETGGTRGQVMLATASSTGQFFQGINIDLTKNVDLTSNKTMTLDVFSNTAITIAPKVVAGVAGAPDSTTSAAHTGSGWETLSFTFDKGYDNTVTANGSYAVMVIYYLWKADNSGFIDPAIDRTFYVDNISGIAAAAAAPDPIPSMAAPIPTTDNSTIYSFYNDTNSYTNNFPVAYAFGQSTNVDLDDTAGVNNALKVNTNVDGFGQGEGGPDDISSYDFVNFNYWFSNTKGTAGFVFIMIDNDGAVQEFQYQVGSVAGGDSEDLVSDAWTQVSIPMSHFTDLGFDSTKLFQWKVDKYGQSGDNGGFLYLDNIVLTQNAPLSLDAFSNFESKVYPNPASNLWNISTPNNVINSVEVYNIIGKRVLSLKYNNSDVSISTNGLSKGIYLAKVNTDLGIKSIKLIKE